MKLVQDCLSARKDRVSRLHHSGGLVKLEQAYLSARKIEKEVFTTEEVL